MEVPMPDKASKRRARSEINKAVARGDLPRPAALPCEDCGHLGDDRRHHYDHHRGYGDEQTYDVQVVCSRCHGARARARNEMVHKTHCARGHALTRNPDGHWRCRECKLEYWRARSKRLHAPNLGCDLS
jgi:stress-induced morphogen